MLTVPWFIARTVQRAWAYNTAEIPSASSAVITSSQISSRGQSDYKSQSVQEQDQQDQIQQQAQRKPQQEQQQHQLQQQSPANQQQIPVNQQQSPKEPRQPQQKHQPDPSHSQQPQKQQHPQQQQQSQSQQQQQQSARSVPSKVTPTQATPVSAIPKPVAKQAHPVPSNTEPAEDSTQTSKKTLVLQPSVSGGRMSEQWAQQQVEKFKFDFDQADKDKSGSLSVEEVLNVLKAGGFRGSRQEGMFIFRHLDKNQDQQISRDEFAAAMKGIPRITIKEFVLRKAFLTLDKDGSGYLTRTEIEDATKKDVGIDIAASKISDLLVYLCKEDKDQKVDYEEFLYVFGVESTATVMSQIFRKLDADNSGFLSRSEILEAVKTEFELKLSADKISALLCAWCKDDDKKISYEEFVKVWLQQKKPKK